ncbi:hypothetical protein LCGC14_0702390 [marine sediment metagenome]|uniref:Uracil-DNA glycosylase-like domain-containing protein n=1 Tax=marine sediment metagenome TaxID=412755 RepID=A0A0F9T399_9ZZZZ
MSGFFFPTKNAGAGVIKRLNPRNTCPCALSKGVRSPRMKPTGQGHKGILWIAEAPGKAEDAEGIQLIGEAGQRLRVVLEKFDIDLDRDCRKTNAVNCRPPKNRTPKAQEINACRDRVWQEIRSYKPKLIFLLGNAAIESFLAHRWKKNLGGVTKWRGWAIPDQETGCWVMATFHPSYVMRQENAKHKATTVLWEQDISKGLALLDKPFPDYGQEDKKINVLTTEEQIITELKKIYRTKPKLITYDYEATGLKPHRKKQKIICASIATNPDSAISFLLEGARSKKLFRAIMGEKRIRKVAHGLKFEDTWTVEKGLGPVRGWKSCTMTNQHILDERSGTSGLKFQVYVRYGLVDYASHLDSFMKGKKTGEADKGGNALNRLDEAPIEETMLYCGMDSMFDFRLYLEQEKEFEKEPGLREASKLFHNGLITLGEVERNGIRTNAKYCKEKEGHIRERVIPHLYSKFKASELGKAWGKEFGNNMSITKDNQLRKVLFEVMGFEAILFTDTGAAKVSKEALGQIHCAGLEEYTKITQLTSAADFLKGFQRETIRGRMHPFFNLNMAASFRSSSSLPNFQNNPIRDKDMKQIVRTAIIPSPGRQILEVDHKGIEVKVSCCVHHDPQMIKYETDPSTDMHRDSACDIYMLTAKEVSPDTRYSAKNGWIFPQFYGDWYESCAKALWYNIKELKLKTVSGMPLMQHLREQGIRDFSKFVDHLEDVEYEFWGVRFKEYTRWKKRHLKEYMRKGWFDLLTGFRCGGVLSRNQVLNRPIQGPAFHCLLWGMIEINHMLRREGFDTFIIGQIHDSIIFDAVPDEVSELLPRVSKIMCEDIREVWPWIILPLQLDAEITPINQPWWTKEKIKI